jgi:Sec-independent protein translocase protein TatA
MGQYTVWELIIILILVAVIFGFNHFFKLIKRLKSSGPGKENTTKQNEQS